MVTIHSHLVRYRPIHHSVPISPVGDGEMAIFQTKASNPTVLGAWIAHVLATEHGLHNVGYTSIRNAVQKALRTAPAPCAAQAPGSPDKKHREEVGDLEGEHIVTLAIEHLDVCAANFALAFLPVEHLLEPQGACARLIILLLSFIVDCHCLCLVCPGTSLALKQLKGVGTMCRRKYEARHKRTFTPWELPEARLCEWCSYKWLVLVLSLTTRGFGVRAPQVAAEGLGAACPDATVQALHPVDRVAGPVLPHELR